MQVKQPKLEVSMKFQNLDYCNHFLLDHLIIPIIIHFYHLKFIIFCLYPEKK
jgi:hypothetical protein